jgi:hypothetical protein
MILPPRQGSVDVADYNQVAEKTSRENSCAAGKLQLSSRIDMFALRNLQRTPFVKPEKRMKRSCFVTDWELEGGGGAEIMNGAHRFRLRRGGGRDEFGGEGNQVWQASNSLIAA